MRFFKFTFVIIGLIASISLYGLDKVFTTVILIDGNPELVDLSQNGDIIKKYKAVPFYFTSNRSHDDFVAVSLADYKAEEELLASIKMIKYDPLNLQLDENAVDKIRVIASYCGENPEMGVLLTAHTSSDENSSHNDQVYRMMDLLQDFGVAKHQIIIDHKTHIGNEVYPFVKVEVRKK